jgi:hypothetical protein
MAKAIILAALAAACCALGACSETYQRVDGVTPGAGDAIAANTAMQMVDPWPNGVQDTRLLVPAARPTASDTGTAASASESQTMSSSN